MSDLNGRHWPMLYTRGKSGETRQWGIITMFDLIIIEHGVVGGQLVLATRKATPKNVGRSNETTGEQQALLEAEAAYKHKVERKYSTTPEAAQDVVPLPMLAKDFNKVKNISYPVDVQPKLDGVRAIARWEGNKVVLISRGGKVWSAVPHINQELEFILPKDSEFDGELYVHGKPFQWITSRAKKAHPDSTELQYCVYDVPTVAGDDSLPWKDRAAALSGTFYDNISGGTVREVPLFFAESYKDVKRLHDSFVADGYEGAIIRLLDGVYEYGHRSSSLLKMKSFDDAEFEIIGHKSGEGIESNLVIWRCKNDVNNLEFDTRPKGTHEDRAKLLLEAESHYGQKLKVKFFGRSDAPQSLPRFPIAEGIRPQEDMDA